ncbi:MAG: HupE/UreJ family protein [Deltaproteobacteria bacterium]
MKRFLLLLAWLLLALPGPAQAHERTYSYSNWTVSGDQAFVSVRVAARDAARLSLERWSGTGQSQSQALGAYLADNLKLLASGRPCPLVGDPRELSGERAFRVYEWKLDCASLRGELAIGSRLLLDLGSRSLHFARVRNGQGTFERVLSRDRPLWTIPGPASTPGPWRLATDYFGLGVGHILGGYDHLAFLLALLLVGGSLAQAAAAVTGFTAGHSVTLALATLGLVRPQTASVEALIALSIVVVAAENLWHYGGRSRAVPLGLVCALCLLAASAVGGWGQIAATALAGLALFVACYFALLRVVVRPQALRWWVALVFGLAHGFGFAGALAATGLPTVSLGWALAGFNLGVEAVQLVAAAALWPLLVWMGRHPRLHRMVVESGSVVVLAAGVFWFVTRNY